MEHSSNPQLLSRGIYTGSVKNRAETKGVTLNETEYGLGRYEGGLHYHENPHITLVFHGGDVEERHGNTYERKAGELFFYHAGEVHQTTSRFVPSKNLHFERGHQSLNRRTPAEVFFGKKTYFNSTKYSAALV